MHVWDIDSIFKENEELKKLVSMNDDRLVELVNENSVLLDEIEHLLKQQVISMHFDNNGFHTMFHGQNTTKSGSIPT